MITILDVIHYKRSTAFSHMLGRFAFNSIKVEIKRVNDISVKCVFYKARNGKVNFKKLDKHIGVQRNHLLCDENLSLDNNMGYKRFENDEFKVRLCTNTALALLSSIKEKKLSIALVDADGVCGDLPKFLLRYSDNVIVVTENTSFYTQLAEKTLEETGAPFLVSKNYKRLYDYDLVIAPYGVEKSACFNQDAVVLTTENITDMYDCTVVYDYIAELSDELKECCKNIVSDTYFASALYTLAHMYGLGSMVPKYFLTNNKAHTLKSLSAVLQKSVLDKQN